jgi:uncharacterized protein YifE (UPF0438 family)
MGKTEKRQDLSKEEQALLSKHLHFYRALASGRRNPITPVQKHFVQVTLGHAAAETPREFAWIKYRRLCVKRRELPRAESAKSNRNRKSTAQPMDGSRATIGRKAAGGSGGMEDE